MQKFVVKSAQSAGRKEATTADSVMVQSTADGAGSRRSVVAGTEPPAQQLQVKMSGYLKKKRKKMGGWRKLWFVLQNQLLLSYSSQEDYEKRLVSFKDVVSLVPGTIIRPTKGPRFIIETASNLIFTYRCDDNKTCSEWITALVESLSLGAQAMLDNKLHLQIKHHYSQENVSPHDPPASKPTVKSSNSTQPTASIATANTNSSASSPASSSSSSKRPISASRSWDSICRAQGYLNPHNRASPNLPIVLSTARILRRHGMPQQRPPLLDIRDAFRESRRSMIETTTSGLTAEQKGVDASGDRVRNFRLHHPGDENTSYNRMHSNNNNHISSPVVVPGDATAADADVATAASAAVLLRRSTKRRQSNSRDVVLRINSMFVRSRCIPVDERPAFGVADGDTDCHDNDGDYDDELGTDGGYAVPDFVVKKCDVSRNEFICNNNNNNISGSHNNNEVEQQQQSWAVDKSSNGGSAQELWCNRGSGANGIDHRRSSSVDEDHHHSLDAGYDQLSGPYSIRPSPPASTSPAALVAQLVELQLRPKPHIVQTSLREIAERRIAGRFASDQALQTTWKQTASATGNETTPAEPIYAVVNLREKYARRAKRQQNELCDDRSNGYSGLVGMDSLNDYQMPKERPKSCNVTGSDYEEVMEFRSGLDIRKHEDTNENIYEPINVQSSEEQLLSPRSPMWRYYFSRINIDALVEIAKRRRPTVASAVTDPDVSAIGAHPPNGKSESTAFVADIRKRWGNHRKSIKNRMKRFYGRDHVHHNKDVETATSDDDLGSQAASCSTSSANSDTSQSGGDRRSGADDEDDGPSSFVLSEIEKYRKGEKHIFGSLGRLRKPRTPLCLDLDAALVAKKSSCGGCVRKRANGVGGDKRGALEFQKELKKEVSRRCGPADGPKKKDQCHSQF